MSVYYRKRGRERECVRRERAYHRAQKRARSRAEHAAEQSTQHAARSRAEHAARSRAEHSSSRAESSSSRAEHSSSRAEHSSSDGIQEARTLRVQVGLNPNCTERSSQIEEQLDTWYRVDASTTLNSIPSIELLPKCSPTRFLVSSWAVFTHECSPTRYQVSSWATFTHKSSSTRYLVYIHM